MAKAIGALTAPATGANSAAAVVPFSTHGRRPEELERLRDQYFREGQLDLALQVAEKVARTRPTRSNYFRLGFLYREAARYRHALRALRDALRFVDGPAYIVPEIHLHLAFTWYMMGRRKRMGESLRRAYGSRWKPRSLPKFHMILATDHFEHRRYRESAREYARAEACSKDLLEKGRNAKNQGIAFYRLGNLNAARAHLTRALNLHKRHAHKTELAATRTIYAAICFEQGRVRTGLGILKRAVSIFHRFGKVDREAEALLNAGYFAGELREWSEARRLLDRALDLLPSQGRRSLLIAALACRGAVSAAEGKFDQAEKDLSRARTVLGRHRDWFGATHLSRAEARIARLLGSWKDVRRAAKAGEFHATKAGDLYRVMEFRKMRAEAEKELGRSKAYESALQGVGRVRSLVDLSRATQRVSRATHRLAASNIPILLVGESDAGALQLARDIHRVSQHANGPCILVPCEALTFPEADLGGHAEGAWSGAARKSLGLVRQAEGGTLILDRVDELPPASQRILIRIVDGRVRAVGDALERPVNVRVIATCQSRARLIPELRYRLEGAVLRVTTLRERPDEIERIVREYLYGRRNITPDALAELTRMPWKGNLVELRSVLDRLIAHSSVSIGRNLVRKLSRTPQSPRPAPYVHWTRQLAPAARPQA